MPVLLLAITALLIASLRALLGAWDFVAGRSALRPRDSRRLIATRPPSLP